MAPDYKISVDITKNDKVRITMTEHVEFADDFEDEGETEDKEISIEMNPQEALGLCGIIKSKADTLQKAKLILKKLQQEKPGEMKW